MSVFQYKVSLVLADSLDGLDTEVHKLVEVLEEEGGAVEYYADPQLIDEGPNKGKWVQELRYAKPGAFL